MDWYPPYVPVGARRARARLQVRALEERGVAMQPVELERRGRAIARSFWGRRWCEHLESFSDYANRLPRGRTYVRNGCVCHLAIETGGVDAMVVGRELYHVVIRIRKLKRPAWKAIRTACAGRIGSVLELLQGRLSDRVMEIVTDRDTGLFPKPGEIKLACDCPDWATMCKHAAAVLYGVGARLDRSPELLFRLRGVDEAELIAADLALPGGAASADTLADDDLGSIFGIELDAGESAAARKPAVRPGQKRKQPKKAPRQPAPRTGASSVPPDAEDGAGPASGFRPTGPLVSRLRERCGFSIAEFSELLRVSAATVRRWEAAPGPLDLQTRPREALLALRLEIEKQGD